VVAELGRFFPSVGGDSPLESPDFGPALRHAILARRDDLAAFIQHGTVQTNETGRGLCWLLPLLSTGWPEVRLVDLGASAGLKLVAEQRAYRLVEASSRATLFDLGLGDPVQFQTRCEVLIPDFANLNGRAVPRVVTRNGCDLAPFPLQNRHDELTLMSFVWGDQLDRLERLKEGIAAFKQINQGDAAVHLSPADLPDDLARFLQDTLTMDDLSLPVVIYNTWMASYLRDNGQSMGYHIDQWAARQNQPVLWTQWEPARDGSQPPHYGWCEWTADLWWDGEHKHWRLGWVHPHGGEAHFEAGLEEYWRFWQS
jgi:hypothetical protein